ncbi:MAG: histidine--tRNA ligase [Bacteroidota bacterium]|nr:histidine--tRNA ligase [Bacteroidota bacterium]
MQKPSIPKGTRDFSPLEMLRRNYIFDTIKESFQRFGYLPIETPAMENLSTLLGKCGEEGDKLLFKVLNSGNYMSGVDAGDFQEGKIHKITHQIAEKGLRYDLTVPFARYIVQHRNDITFPFKRYQVQPVWRADKPQRGRYREFYQCDVDVIGSKSLLNEVELVLIIDDVFSKLEIPSIVRINNRKILSGIAEYIGAADKMMDITIAIDKLDKIGIDNVNAELIQKGLAQEAIDKLQPVINLKGKLKERFPALMEILKDSPTGMKGIEETMFIMRYLKDLQINAKFDLDLTLARGLDYYTGAIIEVTSKDVNIGSICGGGRYDDLTDVFGLPDVSGVGVSFGADRIYDVMKELDLFPEKQLHTTEVFFVNFGTDEEKYCMPLLAGLRAAGICAEIYPEAVKMKKQMTYANNKDIPYVVLVGENEMKEEQVTLKNMSTGEQISIDKNKLLQEILS